jgi:hypothetical protein
MPAFQAIQYHGGMGGGNILISVLTGDATERDRVKAIFDMGPSRPGKRLWIIPTTGRLGPWELR